ncbi:glutamate racemase [bacterium]|nr:glutamate racemase [bacterium]
MRDFPIGVFDSGVGGISTLASLVKLLPNERFIFYADHKYAPYGVQTKESIQKHVFRVVDYLVNRGIKALVVACNTATSAAIDDIRDIYTFPIIGVEPALKVATDSNTDKKIGVMATPLTIKEEKFSKLCSRFKNSFDIELFPAPGLVELIENRDENGIDEFLIDFFRDKYMSNFSHLVLGCTHYIFVKKNIQKIYPHLTIIDGNSGVARHLKKRLTELNLLQTTNSFDIEFVSSGDISNVEKMREFFKIAKTLL